MSGELMDAKEMNGPDGVTMRSGTCDGEQVVEFYTGRWRPMLNADEVLELRDALSAWLEKQGR